ncbi:MAG: Pr6Pr family membrane protein [Verrucomicrobiales bacterium]|nr:Pr6Pr family membrane protein [Verrucomicrobiales bacterium]
MKSTRKSAGEIFLLIVAGMAWAGLILQCWSMVESAPRRGETAADALVELLGYFTILTNLFIGLLGTLPFVFRRSGIGHLFAGALPIGCATTAVVFLAIVYQLLLRHTWNPEGPMWIADKLHHYVVPVSMVVYWCGSSFERRLSANTPILWCLYPLLYFVYVISRGSLIGSYPYPFLDLKKLGVAQIALNGISLLLAFTLVGYLVWAIHRFLFRIRISPESIAE